MVEDMRRKNWGKKGTGKGLKPQKWLLDLLWNSLRKVPRGTQVKRDGLFSTVERRGISSGIALRHLSHPQLRPVCKGPHWRRDCSLRCRPQGSDSEDNLDWRCLGVPTQVPILITPKEPWVLIIVEGQSVEFLWTLGQLSLSSLKPVVRFSPEHYSNGTVWMSQTLLCQSSFK